MDINEPVCILNCECSIKMNSGIYFGRFCFTVSFIIGCGNKINRNKKGTKEIETNSDMNINLHIMLFIYNTVSL